MIVPLAVLSAGSVAAGMIWYEDFFGHHSLEYFGSSVHAAPGNHVISDAHNVAAWVKASPFVAMVVGLAAAWLFYVRNRSIPERLAATHRPLYLFLYNKWYFDEAFDFLFVRPAKWLGRFLWKKGDGTVIDGAINGVTMAVIPYFTRLAGRAQSGTIYQYAFVMVIGLALILAAISVASGGG